MPATKRLVLDLPAEEVDLIERRVAAGEFESPSALVLDRLQDEFAIDEVWAETAEYRAWLAEGDEIVKRIDAGLEPMIPLEEVMAELKRDLAARVAAKGDRTARKRA